MGILNRIVDAIVVVVTAPFRAIAALRPPPPLTSAAVDPARRRTPTISA